MTDYPIEPGSSVDLALDALVQSVFQARKGHVIRELQTVNGDDDAHLLALGVRFWFRKHGITSPEALVAREHARWYGQVTP